MAEEGFWFCFILQLQQEWTGQEKIYEQNIVINK